MSKRSTIYLMIDNWYAISVPVQTKRGTWRVRVFVDIWTLHTVERKDRLAAIGAATLWASEHAQAIANK